MISIIIPIYNVENYLAQCLQSVVTQTYKKIEIILVDDGSTDGSAAICDNYAKLDSRIKVLHKKNEGLVKARKDGLRIAAGDYIGYIDGDDWIEPNMFEKLYNAIILEDVDVAMCGRYENTGDVYKPVYHGIAEGRYDKNALLNKVYPNMIVNSSFFEWGIFPGVWDKLFKRNCLERFQFSVDDRLSMGEDAACTYPCLLNADSIYIMHDCLYHYRQSVNSMVKERKDDDFERKKFNILYNSVLMSFEKYKDIYDMREQWKEYLLFLMVPRAGILYKGIEKLDYLFPFPKVKKGSNIILYGMGTYGQLLHRYIMKSNICNIVATVDRNYVELRKQGLEVTSPNIMDDIKYDFIVVASSFARIRNLIYKDLKEKYGVQKVQVIDEKLIKSYESLHAFGLVD